jgi:hypothetical protein
MLFDVTILDSAWKRSSETCMKVTSAECTVENSMTMATEDARNMQSFIKE